LLLNLFLVIVLRSSIDHRPLGVDFSLQPDRTNDVLGRFLFSSSSSPFPSSATSSTLMSSDSFNSSVQLKEEATSKCSNVTIYVAVSTSSEYYVCLPIYVSLSLCFYVCLCTFVSGCLLLCLSLCMSVCIPICMSVSLYVSLRVTRFLFCIPGWYPDIYPELSPTLPSLWTFLQRTIPLDIFHPPPLIINTVHKLNFCINFKLGVLRVR